MGDAHFFTTIWSCYFVFFQILRMDYKYIEMLLHEKSMWMIFVIEPSQCKNDDVEHHSNMGNKMKSSIPRRKTCGVHKFLHVSRWVPVYL